MKLGFTKMHGLGNDFVVFDFTRSSYPLSSQQAATIANRHFGIGCDQILIVEQSKRADVDFKYRILNADGNEVSQCGNGARCFAKFVHDKGLSRKNPIKVETIKGDLTLHVNQGTSQVTVNMGTPKFSPAEIPLAESEQAKTYTVNNGQDPIHFNALSIGNPHAVIRVNNVEHAPISLIGPLLESHPIFPERANVGFMQIKNRKEISLRVYERGVGETLACGSGACAAVVAGIQTGDLDASVCVQLTGGKLNIKWQGDGHPVMMTGSATHVFDGELSI